MNLKMLKQLRFALGGVAWFALVSGAYAVSPPPSSWPVGNAVMGKAIYNKSLGAGGCKTCHAGGGDTLSGIFHISRGAGPDGATKINNAIIKDIGGMRGHGLSELTAQDISDINAYLSNPKLTAPAAAASPMSLSFPATTVNATSASQQVTLSNSGTAALSLNTFSATGAFTVTSGGSCTTGGSVAANASCTVNVAFLPTSTGDKSGTLTFSHNASPASTSVTLSGKGTAPVASVNSPTLNFPSTTVNTTSASQQVTLSNSGTAALSLKTFSATDAFTVTSGGSCTTGGSVAANASCTVNVAFLPKSTGDTSGTLTFYHNASPASTSVTLSGKGTAAAPTPAPVASVNSPTLNFPSTTVNTTSASQQVTLSNSGTAALSLNTFSATGAFTVTSGGSCSTGGSVAANASCTVNVAFLPTSTGPKSGTLTFTHNASPASTSVTLSGTGTAAAPVASVSSTTLSFPSTTVGVTSASQEVTLTNSGTAALKVNSLTSNNAAFQIGTGGSCKANQSVSAGKSCTVIVSFKPSSAVSSTGTLVFTHNANPTKNTVNLSGMGVAPVASVNPNALSFSQVIKSTTSAQIITVSNSGTAPLELESINIVGTNASEFTKTQDSTCGASVSVNSFCTVSITFTPTAMGTRTASLVLKHNATSGSSSVALNGVGTATEQPVIAVNNNGLNFSEQALTTNSTQTIELTNTGNADLVLSVISVKGQHSADFTLIAEDGNCANNTTLGTNQSCNLKVQFTPTALDTRSASVSISSNTTLVSIGLTGKGTAAPKPAITLSSTNLNFGNATVNTSLLGTITLTNSGKAVLTLTSIAVSGTGFSGTNNCGNSVAVGGSCALSLKFTPTIVNKEVTGSVKITSNAPGSPLTATLTGTGVAASLPVLAWTTVAPSAWPETAVGATSGPISLTLFNQGPGPATLQTLAATTGEFVLGGTCAAGTTLPANTGCSVTVAFNPGQVGARAATLRVTTSTGSNPPVVALAGTGVLIAQPMVAVSSPSLVFPTSTVSSPPAPMDLSVTNVGTVPISLSSLTVLGGKFKASADCGSLPVTLTPAQSCPIKVALSSNLEGAMTDTLTMGTSATSLIVELSANVTSTPTPPPATTQTTSPTDQSNPVAGGCSLVDGRTVGLDLTLWLMCGGALLILCIRRPRTQDKPL